MVILGHHIYYEMQSVSQQNSIKWLDDSNMLGCRRSRSCLI